MGISFSCPFSQHSDLESGLDSIIVKSICFGDNEDKTPARSVSFNGGDAEPTIMKSLGSGRMTLETSVSFKGRDLEKMMLLKVPSLEKSMTVASVSPLSKEMNVPSPRSDSPLVMIRPLQLLDPASPKHMAAIKLQKVYKSFRTRRKLADCAVLVEQSWWKLLDFAELKRSSISFFEIEKNETAMSRWSRARTRAAKVGKGLSKNEKAQKLALQHWLEAIDPRHRYGHNLHFYYVEWLHCQSREPFFYWLDIGEGKEVNLVEKCPRSKLQQQCIKYLGPMERMAYEVVVEDGKFFYKQSGELLHTTGESDDTKWIFVLSASRSLYVGKKKKGTFQHSSFLAGGATSAAGRLVVENGILKAVWPHSGHYRPTEENFRDFVSFLEENNVDLKDVKLSPVDEEEESSLSKKRSSAHIRCNSSEEDLIPNVCDLKAEETIDEELIPEETDSIGQAAAIESHMSSRLRCVSRKLSNLAIPNRERYSEKVESATQPAGSSCSGIPVETPVDGIETVDETLPSEQDYMVSKKNLFDENNDETKGEAIPQESILKRINSHKGMKSFQLGRQLSCKWTTGAGPRIGCVRDYPSELQFRALEHVNLSPRSAARSRSYFSPRTTSALSPRVLTPAQRGGEMEARISSPALERVKRSLKSINLSRTQSSQLSTGSTATAIANVS
ncbi:IQ domain-containing protein IQM2-like [Pyrus communis]|uniref:IQ domain-containing protein IQM2-like n=1 Tax=Pyrus communis TaxID=23211 RepID=UPI0035C125AC